jgi:hypothetical protein
VVRSNRFRESLLSLIVATFLGNKDLDVLRLDRSLLCIENGILICTLSAQGQLNTFRVNGEKDKQKLERLNYLLRCSDFLFTCTKNPSRAPPLSEVMDPDKENIRRPDSTGQALLYGS